MAMLIVANQQYGFAFYSTSSFNIGGMIQDLAENGGDKSPFSTDGPSKALEASLA